MSVDSFFFAADAIGIFCALVISARMLATTPYNLNALLIAGMCLSSACARLVARHEYRYFISEAYQLNVATWAGPLDLIRNLMPGLFAVLCLRLFREPPRAPWIVLYVWIVQLGFEFPASMAASADAARQYGIAEVTAASLELLLLGFGTYWIVKEWSADLVERRRRMRLVFLGIVGTYIFAIVLLERLLLSWEGPLIYHVHVALSLFGVTLLCIALFAVSGQSLSGFLEPARSGSGALTAAETSAEIERDESDIKRLLAALQVERIYRDGQLSIGILAKHIKVPEYRLRKLIHERLGYRNFNALLHEYRITDACAALSDPEQRSVPILTIALTLGYNSINPFNRAFREAKGITPSDFRAKALKGQTWSDFKM